jgi:hypothetical protein
MVTESYLIKRIEMMQEELESLKRTILKQDTGKIVQIKGIWKGVEISDNEINEAKSSWSKE